MFNFFGKNNELRELNQKLGRFLNSIHYSDLNEDGNRAESRARVAVPCAIFPYSEARAPQHYAVGISSDLSLHGLAIFSQDALATGEYIIMIGSGEHRVLVKATLKRCALECFSFYAIGFELTKLLRETDYPAIIRAVSSLDQPSSPAHSP